MKIVRGKKYGQDVYESLELDIKRKTDCLCLNCINMSLCEIAKAFFEICKENNMAVAITRCGVKQQDGKMLFKKKR